jgi:hypothetical protein
MLATTKLTRRVVGERNGSGRVSFGRDIKARKVTSFLSPLADAPLAPLLFCETELLPLRYPREDGEYQMDIARCPKCNKRLMAMMGENARTELRLRPFGRLRISPP